MEKENRFETVAVMWEKLTKREKEAVERICEYPVLYYSDHAEAMHIAVHTFDAHVKAARLKSGAESKLHLYAIFAEYIAHLHEQDPKD
ncbi:MAG: hypothetical protein C4542_08910 [Dehalococcoidia bacterium]|nr:MAG: hypothetical protein C4542_08910 [Dehalococcoidia bacterium]